MKQLFLDAFDNTKIGIDVWDEVTDPIGAVVISHGMAEHPDRYDDFAKYLNGKGYIVLADDHRGHRRGAINQKSGMVNGDSWNQTVNDMDTLVDYAKATYGLKVALLGHSYGSFLSQCYVERHSDKLEGVILSGTAYMKTPLVKMGGMIASLQNAVCGPDKMGNLINKMSFGAYNKPFVSQGQEFAWLSRDKEQVAKYEADPECGYTLCIGYYNSFFKGVLAMYGDDAKKIRKEFPIMIACGSDDPVSNKSVLAVRLADFYKSLSLKPVLKIYKGARHEILNETVKEEVYKDFGDFIDGMFGKNK